MKPTVKRVGGIGCVVLLVAYAAFLVFYFKTMPVRLANSNDLRSKIKWTANYSPNFSLGFHISDTGKIYSAGYSGEITCLDQDGNLEWKSTSPKNSNVFWTVLGLCPIGNGRIVAIFDQPNSSVASPGMQMSTSSGNLEMRIIDSKGAITKQQPLPMLTSFNSMVFSKNQIYIIDSSGIVFAFDLDGNSVWQCSTTGPNSYLPPTASFVSNPNPGPHFSILPVSGMLITIANGTNIFVLNKEGNLHAQFTPSQTISTPSFALGIKDEIYVASTELQAVNPDGQTIWKVPLSNPNGTVAAIEIGSDGSIYVCLADYSINAGEIICINPDGTERWRSTIPLPCTLLAVADNGTVYAAEKSSGLYSIDPFGKENWHLKYDQFSIAALQVTPNGTILISDYSRTWALEP